MMIREERDDGDDKGCEEMIYFCKFIDTGDDVMMI